jgi:hypothetical protein
MAQSMGFTSSNIIFAEANSQQRQLVWELSAEASATHENPSHYVEREKYMSQRGLTRDGKSQVWVLYLDGDPNQIIASCETIRKPILISDGNGSSAREGNGYGITSIYINAMYRRVGMAAYLLQRVQERMDADSDCSALYIDSGKNYYAGLGWVAFSSLQATLTLIPHSVRCFKPIDSSKTRPLHDVKEIRELCERDQQNLVEKFNNLPADGHTKVAFLPTFDLIDWQLARAEFDFGKQRLLSVASSGQNSVTLIKGAITANGRAWTYWAHDWSEKRLRVLRIVRCPRNSTTEQQVDDISVLLEAAVAEASSHSLSRVVVWNPDEEITLGCKCVGNKHQEDVAVTFEERVDEAIPSLRWKGGKDVKGIIWEENDGYCWC